MSGATARAVPLRAPAPAPRLRAVPAVGKRAARAPFVVVVVAVLVSGLLGLLLLNTVVAQQAFTVHDLRSSGRVLAEQEQALIKQVEQLQAPEALAKRAGELGMVPGGHPLFLRLEDQQVLGADGKALKPGDAAGELTGRVTPVAPGVPTLPPKPPSAAEKKKAAKAAQQKAAEQKAAGQKAVGQKPAEQSPGSAATPD